jgi:hypothetical protein
MLPKITDYWDEQVRAIDKAALELLELNDSEGERAASEIAASVREHVRVLPDEILIRATVPVLDDLYKAACATTRWDGGLETYLEASAGTFMGLLAERGFRCQYLVDNAWEDLTRPLELFPPWYQAAGLVYACPQSIARDLMQSDEPGTSNAELSTRMPMYIDEARDVIIQLVGRCISEGRHFTQLDANYVDGSFAQPFEHSGAAGVLTVFRNQAPEPGSTVDLWYPAGISEG